MWLAESMRMNTYVTNGADIMPIEEVNLVEFTHVLLSRPELISQVVDLNYEHLM